MHLNIDQITVYQSLLINKANVNRGSRNGMTCTAIHADVSTVMLRIIPMHHDLIKRGES